MTPADVRVVRGEPDDTELAALVAGLAAGTARQAETTAGHDRHDERDAVARRRWRRATEPMAGLPAPGPDAWRWSGRS